MADSSAVMAANNSLIVITVLHVGTDVPGIG
jgi:hypothetical protein